MITKYVIRAGITDAEGNNEKKTFSNLIVKSNSPRQPRTAGSIASSFRHPEKSIFHEICRAGCRGTSLDPSKEGICWQLKNASRSHAIRGDSE